MCIGGRHGLQTRGPHPQPAQRQRRNFLFQSSLVQPWVQIPERKSHEEKNSTDKISIELFFLVAGIHRICRINRIYRTCRSLLVDGDCHGVARQPSVRPRIWDGILADSPSTCSTRCERI